MAAGGSVINQAGGTISGDAGIVFGAASSGTVIDSGTIIGSGGTAVSFGSGTNSLLLLPDAVRIQSAVYGGAGTSTLTFASAATTGTLTGVDANFLGLSQSTVVAGASWVLAGSNAFVYTPLTDSGTLSNSGSLILCPLLSVAGGTFLNTGFVGGSGPAAISVVSGGVLSNSGTRGIIGSVGTYGYGVVGSTGGNGVYQSSGGVTNATGIVGGSGGGSADEAGVGGVGVAVSGGSLTNAAGGWIAGGRGGNGYYASGPSTYGGAGTGGVGLSVLGGSVTNAALAAIIGGRGGSSGSEGGGGGVGVDVAGGSLLNQGEQSVAPSPAAPASA